MINRNKRKPLCGVATNDADYYTQKRVNGKNVICHFYNIWSHMITRCYSETYQKKKPTYKSCTVCDDWLIFSNFRKWMDSQYWYMLCLDKDILVKGNKIYSPETCIFISKELNSFTTDSGSTRGNFPIGVHFHKKAGKFRANCNNPFTLKVESLGLFSCPNEAHKAWKARKHELACQWANIVGDERLKHALRNRYL